VGLTDVEVDRRGQFVSATVHIIADVTASGAVQDIHGDRVEYITSSFYSCHIAAPLIIDLTDGAPSGLNADTGEAEASPSEEYFHESEDAFEACIAAISTVPGLANFEWTDAYDDTRETSRIVNGEEVTVHISDIPYGEWEMYVTVADKTSSSIRCEQDVSRLTWDEGEVFSFEPTWHLSADAGSEPDNPSWYLAAFMATALYLSHE